MFECPVAVQVRQRPDDIALMTGELFWTFRELDERVQSVVCALRQSGLISGDVLMVCGRNSPRLVALILACLRTGVIVLPVNPSFPKQKLTAIAEQVGIHAFWGDEDIAPDIFESIRFLCAPGRTEVTDWSFSWDDNRICNLVLTSGSSGLPKAAAHNFSCHRASAEASLENIPLAPGNSWLLSLPLFHIGGLATLFRCLLAGATVILPDHRSDLTATLIRRQVSHLSLVNTQLYRLIKDEQLDFSQTQARLILMGGGYVPADLVERCQQQGITMLTSYGMTEMSSQICTGSPVFGDGGAVTSGAPLSGNQVTIDDEGNVLVKGISLFKGYWQKGQLKLPLTDNGWFVTGDKGHWLEDDGRRLIQITGRADFQFVSGGENIQPESIERVILGLPEIQQTVVVPLPNEEFGQRPVAFIECGGDFTPELWQQALRKQLPGFMVPDDFLPWPEPSKSGLQAGLKIDRKAFAQLASQLLAST